MGVVIVAMVLGFTLIVVKMGLDYSKSKLLEAGKRPPDATLLMSELQEMIAGAVAEATDPLRTRVDQLEQNQLPASSSDETVWSSVGEAAESDVDSPENA